MFQKGPLVLVLPLGPVYLWDGPDQEAAAVEKNRLPEHLHVAANRDRCSCRWQIVGPAAGRWRRAERSHPAHLLLVRAWAAALLCAAVFPERRLYESCFGEASVGM